MLYEGRPNLNPEIARYARNTSARVLADIVKDADYLIDLGPEGGEQGGHLVACGSPLDVINDGKRSYTARFLREYLNGGVAPVKSRRRKPSLEEAPA